MICRIEDIERERQISSNIPTQTLHSFIRETENIRVIPVIGYRWHEILDEYCAGAQSRRDIPDDERFTIAVGQPVVVEADGTNPHYELLLRGGAWTDRSGNEHYCYGLRRAIALLTYARFVIQNQLNVTAFGVVMKITESSTPIEFESIKMACNTADKTGSQYLHSVKEFIDETFLRGNRKIFKQKFTIIGE
jgi:hypothetical protein